MATMNEADVRKLAWLNFPSFIRQVVHVERIESWLRTTQDEGVFIPKGQEVTEEYKRLAEISPTSWLALVVRSLQQKLYVDGIRRPKSTENMQVWDTWQRNRMDKRQIALHRAALGHGQAFAIALPGKEPLSGRKMAAFDLVSARKMAAFYDNPEADEWPQFAIRATRTAATDVKEHGWDVRVYDENAVHVLKCKADGDELEQWTYVRLEEEHSIGVTPVVRYAKELDLDGRATGVAEPLIPLAARIDQDVFDRLIVQRFGAWKVRYIAGLVKPDKKSDQVAEAMRLKIEDLLISTDPNTKFGTLDATDLKGFIDSHGDDLRSLSAISQTPPHHLLGVSSNLQAEALAAAEGGLNRNADECKVMFGEDHEQLLRLAAHIEGNEDEAQDFHAQTRWADTESRSLAQAADALGKLATQLKIPLEMLWERVPGWTDLDTERAKELVENGSIDQLIAELAADLEAKPDPAPAGGGGQ